MNADKQRKRQRPFGVRWQSEASTPLLSPGVVKLRPVTSGGYYRITEARQQVSSVVPPGLAGTLRIETQA
jgi:hypothetical protein